MYLGVPLFYGHVCPGEKNQSWTVSVHLIEKSSGSFRIVRTSVSFSDPEEIASLYRQPVLSYYTVIPILYVRLRSCPNLSVRLRSCPNLSDPDWTYALISVIMCLIVPGSKHHPSLRVILQRFTGHGIHDCVNHRSVNQGTDP